LSSATGRMQDMTDIGKVRVLVRSTRVPVRTTVLRRPVYSHHGIRISTDEELKVVYEDVLDEQSKEAIRHASKLSQSLGLRLELVDMPKKNLFGRVISYLARRSPSATITIVPSSASVGPRFQPRQEQESPGVAQSSSIQCK
jgi:hypothetical protein